MNLENPSSYVFINYFIFVNILRILIGPTHLCHFFQRSVQQASFQVRLLRGNTSNLFSHSTFVFFAKVLGDGGLEGEIHHHWWNIGWKYLLLKGVRVSGLYKIPSLITFDRMRNLMLYQMFFLLLFLFIFILLF